MRRSMIGLILLTATVTATFATTAAVAAIPSRTPQELEDADAIVVGKAVAVRATVDTDAQWERRKGIVVFEIERIEKGNSLKPGEQVEIHFRTQRWVGKGRPNAEYGSGHEVPEIGVAVRAHLETKDEGGYEALLPNGMVTLPKDDAPKKPTRGT